MKIDITQRIEEAVKVTDEWAAAAGYLAPEIVPEDKLSKKARDVSRILGAAEFGCQTRQVKALMEVLLGEKLPDVRRNHFHHYENPHIGFRQGVIVIATAGHSEPWGREGAPTGRAGMVMRTSKKGSAGLRYSSGEYRNAYIASIPEVRPANEQEIRDYFEEFYGLKFNPLDTIEEPEDEEAIPF